MDDVTRTRSHVAMSVCFIVVDGRGRRRRTYLAKSGNADIERSGPSLRPGCVDRKAPRDDFPSPRLELQHEAH
jgi:hypothetical protein